MIAFDLENKTFTIEAQLGFEDLTAIRDGLQLLVNEATTSPEPNLPDRLNKIQMAAEALGVSDNIDWTAEA